MARKERSVARFDQLSSLILHVCVICGVCVSPLQTTEEWSLAAEHHPGKSENLAHQTHQGSECVVKSRNEVIVII